MDYLVEDECLPNGTNIYNVYRKEDRKIICLCQCHESAQAHRIVTALEWYDSLNDGIVKGRPRIATKAQDWDVVFEPAPKPSTRRKAK